MMLYLKHFFVILRQIYDIIVITSWEISYNAVGKPLNSQKNK
jgi:hypothetical protein